MGAGQRGPLGLDSSGPGGDLLLLGEPVVRCPEWIGMLGPAKEASTVRGLDLAWEGKMAICVLLVQGWLAERGGPRPCGGAIPGTWGAIPGTLEAIPPLGSHPSTSTGAL